MRNSKEFSLSLKKRGRKRERENVGKCGHFPKHISSSNYPTENNEETE